MCSLCDNPFKFMNSFAMFVSLQIYNSILKKSYFILGNHESAMMNQMYGFDGEVKAKYTAQMAELFTEVYNWLPLAHCLNNRVLVRV